LWVGFGPRVRLALLLLGAVALLLGPSPAGVYVGHRFTASPALARKLPGAPAQHGEPGDQAAGGGSTAQPGAAAATGSAKQPNPSGSATPSPPTRPGYTPAGAMRRTGTEAVALTFDDGPDPVQTPLILDLLKQHGVKATFCLVGFRARDNPELVARIVAEGHTLCNHSWQHLTDLATKPPEYIRHDLEITNKAIRAAVPGARIAYFRAPGGNFTPDLVWLARRMGMASIYWQVDPRDWEHKNDPTEADHIARIIAAIQHETRPGAIVLSHDNRQPATIEAYKVLLPWLKERFTLAALPT
jgi:peptidoglycan/xylan/chitin deacetylase (PgdA/CDA1 family)